MDVHRNCTAFHIEPKIKSSTIMDIIKDSVPRLRNLDFRPREPAPYVSPVVYCDKDIANSRNITGYRQSEKSQDETCIDILHAKDTRMFQCLPEPEGWENSSYNRPYAPDRHPDSPLVRNQNGMSNSEFGHSESRNPIRSAQKQPELIPNRRHSIPIPIPNGSGTPVFRIRIEKRKEKRNIPEELARKKSLEEKVESVERYLASQRNVSYEDKLHEVPMNIQNEENSDTNPDRGVKVENSGEEIEIANEESSNGEESKDSNETKVTEFENEETILVRRGRKYKQISSSVVQLV